MLKYPFNAEEILKKKKSIKKEFLSKDTTGFLRKNIAILGGVTTENIRLILELFLMDQGIEPVFYESEYNKFYEDGMFPNPTLLEFKPDIIYICTSIRNITDFPALCDSKEVVEKCRENLYKRFENLWNNLSNTYHCPIIQNNFEYPYFRLLGNKDAVDIHGRVNFITRLNLDFYDYANSHDNFYICDINYISASYGLEKWSQPFYWNMYKYATIPAAIPYLAFNVSNIIKSLYGKNKKAFSLDLDNTLWGGVVGDEGPENIEIGQETAVAESYSEFQEYIKLHKDLGILLTVNSKNNEENALAGLKRPDSILSPEDFSDIRANWDPKSKNLKNTSDKLNLLPESFVFVDDNPAERAIIKADFPNVETPEIGNIEDYIRIIDKSGFFEVTNFSEDDLKRSEMYAENKKREESQAEFTDYNDYLISLEMVAEIQDFKPMYMSRISQLTNKSNQFNLTTKRYSQAEIEEVAKDGKHITLYGRLTDRFGDNGVVSVVIGAIKQDELHMELWIMSCRVLKRDMEFAMMDVVVKKAGEMGIKKIVGYYYPTAKNSMVKDFYQVQGFDKISCDEEGNTVWEYIIPNSYKNKQDVIRVED